VEVDDEAGEAQAVKVPFSRRRLNSQVCGLRSMNSASVADNKDIKTRVIGNAVIEQAIIVGAPVIQSGPETNRGDGYEGTFVVEVVKGKRFVGLDILTA
jgi:hypothetical protein